jgi:hypothetical protein
VEIPRSPGEVPHYLPGANPYLTEFPSCTTCPTRPRAGGAKTTYPEYGKALRSTYKRPDKCTVYCCGWHHAGDDEQLAGRVPHGRPAGYAAPPAKPPAAPPAQ